MKNLFILASLAVLMFSPIVFASNSQATTSSFSSGSPQVYQFSLSHYTGTINSSSTKTFTVGLSCPQETDAYATVIVVIEGELVASEVVKVPAGKTKSTSTSINVGSSYDGKSYKLGVQ